MVVLDHNPFVLRIFDTPLRSFIPVVTVYTGIERTGDNDPDSSGRPFGTGSCFVTGSIEHPGSVYERLMLHVVILYHLADLFLVLPDGKRCFIRIIIIPERDAAAVPQPTVCPGDHSGCDTLRGHVTFKFCKYQDDFQHGFPNSGRSVKLFVLADKSNPEFLQFLVHFRKVQKISGDTVYLPDEYMGKFSLADPLHHFLKSRTVGVLSRVAGILEYLVFLYT